MAKRGSWYFENYQAHYEINEKGRRKKVLTYTGEYYGVRKGDSLLRLRLLMTADALLLTAALLLIQFFPGIGGMLPWVGIPCMWALVPLIFLYIGLVNFLTCGGKWMARQYYAGYRRMKRSAIAITVLMSVTTLSHLVFLILWPEYFPGELYYTLGALLCALLSGGLLLMQKRHPAIVVQGPTIR